MPPTLPVPEELNVTQTPISGAHGAPLYAIMNAPFTPFQEEESLTDSAGKVAIGVGLAVLVALIWKAR
ncbi:MAG: hypothetical protein OXR68_00235 [Alphaproteobacteria bacterium]|nr:hypothetical protein [Alphaproteobacteria bacterium]MDD9919039.1 hypothetical protein [Alphaproteobacteria bacterium]